MKLSQLSTEMAADVLCEITPCIYNITSDENIVSTIGKMIDVPDGTNNYGFYLMVAERITQFIPALLKDHREDVFGILSALGQRTRDEIAAQPIFETIEQVEEIFTDEDFRNFLKRFLRRGKIAPSAPSAPSPEPEA